MKASTILIILIASILALGYTGCRKKRTTGDISVTLTVLQGETVTMTGIEVQLHGTSLFDNILFHKEATGTATNASAQFEELVPDDYYVCAWLDNDSDLKYSSGDFFGFYPYPVNLEAGVKKDVPIEVYVLD